MRNASPVLICAVLLSGCYQMVSFEEGGGENPGGDTDTNGAAGEDGDGEPAEDDGDPPATDTGADTETAPDISPDTDSETDTDADTGVDTGPSPGLECQGPGVWLDETSGLCWGGGAPKVPWCKAGSYCEELTVGGYDDWRFPTIDELRTLIRGCHGTATGGECRVAHGSGLDAWSADCMGCDCSGPAGWPGCCWEPALGKLCGWVCSASAFDFGLDYAWCVNFASGHVYYKEVDCADTPFIGSFELGCVRG